MSDHALDLCVNFLLGSACIGFGIAVIALIGAWLWMGIKIMRTRK